MKTESFRYLDKQNLTSFAYSINTAGGGGNIRELYNPNRVGSITGLVEEIGSGSVPLVSFDSLKPGAMVCSIARLGSPGARADNYAQEGAKALTLGLEKLHEALKCDLPSAFFPVEATAGQMARTIRAARAASAALGKEISILDGDVCGGLAVPAVPHAFNIYESLRQFPDVALIELLPKDHSVEPHIEMIKIEDPEKLEESLRQMAGQTPLGAVWFAWLMSAANEFSHFFTPGAVNNSIRRGEIVRYAIERGENPAEALINAGEADKLIANGQVAKAQVEDVPGFKQIFYTIDTDGGPIDMAARNEYIVIYKGQEIIAEAPDIICVIGSQGPIQSHLLKEGDAISIVSATPQCLLNNPQKRDEWQEHWQRYFREQQQQGLWAHPY